MKLCSLSSGSSGNAIYIETEKSKFLIDAGFSGVQIETLLKAIGVQAKELDFLLVTHEHSDHIKGVGVLSRRYDLPIYANYGTWMAMTGKLGKIKEKNIQVFKTDREFSIRDVDILPIGIYHDSAEAVGYIVENAGEKLSVTTDTGFVSESMIDTMRGSGLVLLESNHDPRMLEEGPYPPELKKRIRGLNGHLSNLDSARVLGELLSGSGERVLLGHLSEENNLPALAFETVVHYLTELGLDTGRDICIEVAARYEPGELITIGEKK